MFCLSISGTWQIVNRSKVNSYEEKYTQCIGICIRKSDYNSAIYNKQTSRGFQLL